MRVSLLGLILVLPLAACSLNPKEAPANQQAQQNAADAATCTGYGFKKDTPEFANCLMTLDGQHKGYEAHRPNEYGQRGSRFRNPSNGYEEKVGEAWLWSLLLGPIYFAAKGIWFHAVLSLLLAIVTSGISWFIYPFFANWIVRKHYL